MNPQCLLDLSHDKYGLLFDVRRSVRYHDRRRAFYELMHQITGLLTILMAGSVLFDLAKSGSTAWWLIGLSVVAALMAAMDMVVGYNKRANLHGSLRERFALLEIDMIDGDTLDATWQRYQRTRLQIEKDEPAVYKIVDLLCHNELLVSEGVTKDKEPVRFAKMAWYHVWTSHLWRWENHQPV